MCNGMAQQAAAASAAAQHPVLEYIYRVIQKSSQYQASKTLHFIEIFD